jgi:PncC family amidohydrolase
MTFMQSEPPELLLGRCLSDRGMTLAAAESCTGGLIADRITDVPGSSRYFLGSVVVYSAALKEKLLGVRRETIQRHTVYSADVALEMARGVRQVTEADIGVGVTGIAGPDGGTAEQPVGLVFIAVATAAGTRVERLQYLGDRSAIKEQAAEHALKMVIDTVNGPTKRGPTKRGQDL